MAGSKRPIERFAWQKLAEYMGPHFYGASGDVYWVDSGVTTSGNGTFYSPYSTIDAAINACTASHGDVVAVKSRHAETISAATNIVMDTIDVAIVGLGENDNRPLLSFSLAAGNIPISAAGCSIRNVRTTVSAAVDVTAMFTVTAAGVTLKDIEVLNPSATYETVQVVLASTAASRLVIDGMAVRGSTGSAMTQCIDLTAVTDAVVKNCNFDGSADNWIEFATACTNAVIENCTFRGGVTPTFGFTHDILDTAGTSTYRVINCFDVSAGKTIYGSNVTGVGCDSGSCKKSVIASDVAATNANLFTTYGTVIVDRLGAIVASADGVMTVTPSIYCTFSQDAVAAAAISAVTAAGITDAKGTSISLIGAAATDATLVSAAGAAQYTTAAGNANPIVLPSVASGIIKQVVTTDSAAGSMRWFMKWRPAEFGAWARPCNAAGA